MRFIVKKAHRTWDVIDTNHAVVVEGGFFTQGAAERCARQWERDNFREVKLHQNTEQQSMGK